MFIANAQASRTQLTLAGLAVIKDDVETLSLSTEILDNDTRAADDLACVALTVDLAETSPGAEEFGVRNPEEADFVLGAECLDELDVFRLRASLDKNTKVGLTLVKSLGTLTQTTSETIVGEGVLQDLLYVSNATVSMYAHIYVLRFQHYLKSILNRKLALGSCLSGGFNLYLSDLGVDFDFISSVRHSAKMVAVLSISPTSKILKETDFSFFYKDFEEWMSSSAIVDVRKIRVCAPLLF